MQRVASTRAAVVVGCLACLSIVGCSPPPPPQRDAQTTPVPAPAIPSPERAYEPPARETMLAFARGRLGPAAPASFGTTVVVTPREPAVGPVELFVSGASAFDPAFGSTGLIGNDGASGSSRYGLWIRPNPNRSTIVDCEIAGTRSLVVTTQVFSAAGEFIGEVGSQTLTRETSELHWSIAVPWDSQFTQYGVFRLMLIPVNATATNLWGCQVSLP